MAAAKAGESRMKSYKTKGLDMEELRRRKEEEGVELRKAKRDSQVIDNGSKQIDLCIIIIYL